MKWINTTSSNDNTDHNNGDILAAACMHAGCKVYHLNSGKGNNDNNDDNDDRNGYNKYSIDSTTTYHDDSSNHLAYGIDVITTDCINNSNTTTNSLQIAMCSFYDNKLDIVQCNL